MLWNIIKISLSTFLSKIIGFIRDITIANFFGINIETDSFYTAFRLPNMLRKIFAEGAFTYVFIPILSEYKQKYSKKKINELISTVYFILLLILIIITILGIIIAPQIIKIMSPGFIKDKNKFQLTVNILKITFPYIILISLSSYLTSILNIWNVFLPPTFIPIILNTTIIFCNLFIIKYFNKPIYGLAWSIIIGGILQLIYQKISIKYLPLKIKFNKINLFHPGIKKIFINICPVILGMLMYQISQILNSNITSYLQEGSTSWIYYADRLIELPLSIIGTTISSILLTQLSNSYHKNDKLKFNNLINKYIKITLLLSIPISIFLIFTSKFIIITLFKYGKFTIKDVLMTSKILIAYAFGLTGLIFIKIITPCFYSQYNTQIPIKIALLNLISTQIINIFTIKIFKYSGLALSISISSYINSIILYLQLKKKKIIDIKYNWILLIIKIIISSIIMLFSLNFFYNYSTNNFINLSIRFRLMKLLFITITSGSIYIISLFLLGIKIN